MRKTFAKMWDKIFLEMHNMDFGPPKLCLRNKEYENHIVKDFWKIRNEILVKNNQNIQHSYAHITKRSEHLL